MALTASPPPELPSAANDAYIDQLDDDIAKVRAEIANLSKRRSLLSASLLSSTKVQTALQSHTGESSNSNLLSADTSPLLDVAEQQSLHNQVNVHRLAFGITAFPFTDPSPETSDEPLLGIRFDIPSQNGRFDHAPYYLFCKKLSSAPTITARSNSNTQNNGRSSIPPASNVLVMHHHTIPAFVPLRGLLEKYLPQPSGSTIFDGPNADDEGYDSSGRASSPTFRNIANPTGSKIKQNVHALAAAVYTYLSAQANRKAAIALLSEPLHPSLSSMSVTGEDCHFVRLIWHDGLVGRLKLNEDGIIERAVVFGDEGRMRDMERLLSQDDAGAQVPIMSLRARLDEVARRRGREMEVDEAPTERDDQH